MNIVLLFHIIELSDSTFVLWRIFIVSNMLDNGHTGSADVIYDNALVEGSINSSSGDSKVAKKMLETDFRICYGNLRAFRKNTFDVISTCSFDIVVDLMFHVFTEARRACETSNTDKSLLLASA